jgi:hypothetical protein
MARAARSPRKGGTMNHVLLTLLALFTLAACADAPPAPELGSLSVPLQTSSPTHTYNMNADAELRDSGGALVQWLSLGGPAAAITVDELEPGAYTLTLMSVGLAKDNVGMPQGTFTLTSPNPLPLTVTAGATTPAVISFDVAGDPVVFECTEETCGAVAISVAVTEVPPEE